MRNIFLFIGALLPLMIFGQESTSFQPGPNGYVRCATVEYQEMLRQANPLMESQEQFESWLQQKMQETARNENGSRAVITVPVIVHVIHEGEAVGSGRNISAAQIQSQIDVLNEDFRRAPNTPGFNNDPVGADAEIEFCLAFVDTTGRALQEPGIHRVDRNSLGITPAPYSIAYTNANIKPQTVWDPTQYFNIWVTEISGGILGFAQFPNSSGINDLPGFSGNANTDGVVIGYRYFGRVGNLSAPYNEGRTATHEIGHAFGLRHIWGDGGCGVDDGCADTPESDAGNYGCLTNHVSCGTTDMIQNYMDYSDDRCFNIFTACQAARMRTVFMNSPRRRELINSTVCARPTAAPTAGWLLEDSSSCDGFFQFRDTSQNIPTNWFWNFGDGGTSTDRDPVHRYAQSGTYTVTLVVNNSLGSNGFSRQVTVNISAAASVDAGPDIRTCAGELVPLNVNVSDPTASVRWSPSIGITNPNVRDPLFQATTTRTYFVTATDANGCSATDTLTITVAPRPQADAGADVTLDPPMTPSTQLNGSATNQVASWQWSPAYGFTSADTIPNPTVEPDRTVEYTLTIVDVNNCTATDKVLVTVPGTWALSIESEFENTFGTVNQVFPNPASQEAVFSADFQQARELQVALFDLGGKRMATVYEGTVGEGSFLRRWQRPGGMASGLYFAVWRMGEARYIQKIQLR
jgi:hypothetical protein